MKNSDTITVTTHEDGTPYTGTIIDYYDDGSIEGERTFKNGLLDGPFKHYNENGIVDMKGTYNNYGKMEGCFKYYGKNGEIISEETYKNGVKNGVFKFYKDGHLKLEGKHKQDQVDGVVKTYNEKGQFELEVTHKDGKLIEPKKH